LPGGIPGRAAASISSAGKLRPLATGTAKDDLFATEPDDPAPDLGAHGELPRSERLELFVGTMEQVVFPGLERCEIDPSAGRRWIAEHGTGASGRSPTEV
jgi:hypothetical protein